MFLLNTLLLLAITVLAFYFLLIRPWQLRWGARDEEVAMSLPGDEIVAKPHFHATRVVSIDAPPAAITPWIAQMGCNRAGFYSYDWIDNRGKPSARRVLQEFQNIREGDFIPMTPDGNHGMWIKAVKPDEYILWWDKQGKATWLWYFLPEGPGATRLLTRLRVRYKFTFPWVLYFMLQDAGDIIMMKKCMLGIKMRAERLSHKPQVS